MSALDVYNDLIREATRLDLDAVAHERHGRAAKAVECRDAAVVARRRAEQYQVDAEREAREGVTGRLVADLLTLDTDDLRVVLFAVVDAREADLSTPPTPAEPEPTLPDPDGILSADDEPQAPGDPDLAVEDEILAALESRDAIVEGHLIDPVSTFPLEGTVTVAEPVDLDDADQGPDDDDDDDDDDEEA